MMNAILIDKAVRERFVEHLRTRQLSEGTISRYIYHLSLLTEYAGEMIRDIDHFLGFRDYIKGKNLSVDTVNNIYSSVNKFMVFLKVEWRLNKEKVQRRPFIPPERFLTKDEYSILLAKAAELGDDRLSMLLQTICSTGIRVSELRFITVECLSQGFVQVKNKGKIRPIILPKALIQKLKRYCREHSITSGPVFVTRSGKPLDRSNIWKMMKRLAKLAGVAATKVFPHNLRHLFARTFEEKYHDTPSLATVLGHSSINTTRIYIASNGQKERQMMDALGQILTEIPQS